MGVCCICYQRDVNCVLDPCGHQYCFDCINNEYQCPICRKHIVKVIDTYNNFASVDSSDELAIAKKEISQLQSHVNFLKVENEEYEEMLLKSIRALSRRLVSQTNEIDVLKDTNRKLKHNIDVQVEISKICNRLINQQAISSSSS
ncbi:RING-finger domain-containing protein [Tetraselmis virus 1]|uniref:RING-finger domain-containing protein n=1 Tax=Tetraselmis virus 1 TaxID=2060617 RepID=A0A2P0VP86_9VIRU|nr:RING-finger domain-containing protein [Tetraselmis virus 1]AUF82725.1 RING-finger domain-containing protein [Tetraselmis virus 1]